MPAVCRVCANPNRVKIEADVFRNSLREVAREHGLSASSLHRHKAHMTASAPGKTPEQIIEEIEQLIVSLRRIAIEARRGKRWSAAALAIREIRACLETLGRLRAPNPPVHQSVLEGLSERELLEHLARKHGTLRETLASEPGRLEIFDRLVAGVPVSEEIWAAFGGSDPALVPAETQPEATQ